MTASDNLKNKVFLVTGAGNGIGEAVAISFLGKGSRVAAVDLSQKNLEKLKEKTSKFAEENLIGFTGDASDYLFSKHAVDQTFEEFGRIDGLINCAGGSYGHGGKKFIELSEHDWKTTVEGNYYSALNFTRHVLPHMIKAKHGVIINMGSTTALGDSNNGGDQLSVYSSTKGAIISFTKAIAREVARDGIRVNCVSPGITNTDAVKRLPVEMIENLRSLTPMGRICEPQDVANLVLFLASEDSSFMTGINVVISGGLVMM